MRIDHIAIWVRDLEKIKNFYSKYFDGIASDKYYNPKKTFTSYFISFTEGCRLELMHKPEIIGSSRKLGEHIGITHFAVAVGSPQKVDQLTELLRADGYNITGEPRTTGDGYYESVVLDPENNRIEITS